MKPTQAARTGLTLAILLQVLDPPDTSDLDQEPRGILELMRNAVVVLGRLRLIVAMIILPDIIVRYRWSLAQLRKKHSNSSHDRSREKSLSCPYLILHRRRSDHSCQASVVESVRSVIEEREMSMAAAWPSCVWI